MNNGVETENSNTMEIWRKMQIANVVLALVAVVLTVVAFGQPSFVNAAMWAWSITLWVFMFLVPMPVIERNKAKYRFANGVMTFLAILAAISVFIWFRDNKGVDSFSSGVLIYTVVYTAFALLFAAWLKIKENKK